jgi:NAD(P)-dependent dehydrogenase (short-subunit alcohol dehydrogenase family)
MSQQEGLIVCTARLRHRPAPAAGYSASKAGVINLTTTAANYLAGATFASTHPPWHHRPE